MTNRFGRTTQQGIESTPTTDIARQLNIAGLNTALGDSSTTADASTGVAVSSHRVGWFGSPSHRQVIIMEIPLDVTALAGHDIVEALHYLPIVDPSTDFDATFPPAGIWIDFYALRVDVDMTDATWTNRDTTGPVAWGWSGGKAGVDYESTPIYSLFISNDDYDTIVADSGGATTPVFFTINLTSEVARAAALGRSAIYVMLRGRWAKPSSLDAAMVIQNSRTNSTVPHGYTDIRHLPPVAFFSLFPDGSIDYAGFYDNALVDRDARIQTGYPAPGGTGPSEGFAVANATDNDLNNLVLISARAIAETPSRPTSRRMLKHVEVYDAASGEGFIDGTTRLVPMPSFESTRYQAYTTPAFGTETGPLTFDGGAVYGLYASDSIALYASDKAFRIRPEWWAATAIVGDEEWVFDHRAYALPAGYTPAAAERHYMTCHEGYLDGTVDDDRSLPDDRFWRDCWNATVQQATGSTRTATANYAPEGNISRTFQPVGNTDRFAVGQTVTIWEDDIVEYATIRGILDRTDGTHPDELAYERVLTNNFTANAKVTNGVLIHQLTRRDRSTVLTGASPGSTYIDLTTPLLANGIMRLYNLATGDSEERNYVMSGNRAQFQSAQISEFRYEAGDLVNRVEETSWVPAFVRLKPEEGAEQEEQLSLIRVVRKKTK